MADKNEEALRKVIGMELSITIHEGKDLAAKDFAIFGKGSSDPFIVCSVGDKTLHKTKVISKNLSPVWNETFKAYVTVTQFQRDLLFSIFDDDLISKDEMGEVRVPLKTAEDSCVSKWFTVQPSRKSEKVSGEIRLEINFKLVRLPAGIPETLVGRWNFASGSKKDELRNFSSLKIYGTAKLTPQGLEMPSSKMHFGLAHVEKYKGSTIKNKTLISWLKFNAMDCPDGGGTALSMYDPKKEEYDGLVHGERLDNAWTAGSARYKRTPHPDKLNPTTTTAETLVKVAASWNDDGKGQAEVKFYKDDELSLEYTCGPMTEWVAGSTELFFGKRHGPRGGETGVLNATLIAAEIHNAALSASEIKNRSHLSAQGISTMMS